MTEFEVGQIWGNQHNDKCYQFKFTITIIEYHKGIYYYIFRDGSCGQEKIENLVKDISNNVCKIIASYPTWQEAITSKEFKGEI